MIPADDPVRLLSAFVEGMELSDLYASYERVRKNQASPRQLFKVIVYAGMNRLYSSRDIETACRRDINFMYLLEGMPPPDHATIARFVSLHFGACSKKTLAEVTALLHKLGEISGKSIFIDGTKMESCANKYTFVWKKAVTKSMAKLFDKITRLVEECENLYGLKVVYDAGVSLRTLKRLRRKLYRIKREEQVTFAHGSGKRKTSLQRSLETLEKYMDKLKEYIHKVYVCGERSSYSKTDTDAAFMHMKEDAMRNGQLKPAYNLQHGVDSEYITWLDVSAHPADVLTLIPFLKDMEKHLPFKYREIVADAGYESEENYVFIEGNGQTAYIKPQNYEISKTRKYRNDISRRENMEYREETDSYICKNGRELSARYDKKSTNRNGYTSVVTIYECESCRECPCKEKCIRAGNCKTPIEERTKHLNVSKVLEWKRKEDLERITSEYGTQLRVNRSIQAEGSFAETKEDMNFRRYSYRGKANVLAQSILLAIGRNINKLHHKIQSGHTGRHLFPIRI